MNSHVTWGLFVSKLPMRYETFVFVENDYTPGLHHVQQAALFLLPPEPLAQIYLVWNPYNSHIRCRMDFDTIIWDKKTCVTLQK